jgi:hypothetical protein
MTESLCFSITGEFVTETARSWLYEEKRPYEKVIEFLLSCMFGTNFDNSTLKKLAHDVLMGKKKFVGTTKDDSFGMVDDDEDIIKKYPFAFENKPEPKITLEKEIRDDNPVMQNIRAYGKRIREKKLKTVKVISTDDYGFLRPDGKFFEVEWGSHDSWARSYLEKHYPNVSTFPYDEGYYPGDFLVKKGWLLLHNPCRGCVRLFDLDISSATQKQKEFLYDYFMERDEVDDARAIWAETT